MMVVGLSVYGNAELSHFLSAPDTISLGFKHTGGMSDHLFE